MEKRKNLANCTPREAFQQMYRIKDAAEKWIRATQLFEIRKRRAVGIETIPADADDATKERIAQRNKERVTEQAKRNVSAILDAALRDHPDETLEILALSCFVEPKDVDSHSFSWYLANFGDIINDPNILDFFTSLVQLEQTGLLKA